MAFTSPSRSKRSSIIDRIPPIVHVEVATGDTGRAYRNRLRGGVWQHTCIDGTTHEGLWQQCRLGKCVEPLDEKPDPFAHLVKP